MMYRFILFIFLITALSAISCMKKQETLAKTEVVSSDSLLNGEISDEMLDEFEYEADSLAIDEEED
jgi:hypothetical protein